ncbi:leucine/isoleucine/valine transporter subunit; ATP-binding component of ABC superfamily [Tepidanaerobacter acetatoxydans Re1]|uniref:Leucine/isoleucine/valine transporter subunit ATP-binding component of ABC superfamily n=1 Tax=Tepidanaerobacter acetatoxydans (strain DSM 21804 / JCM 16047 / Re1) TaxID=1209989 RepID=U4QD00_TEPAE|nr:leucine/isoleucine/valine transporter subunit; ATP-binding component of ABC superfamily [Tepidanaerobacter acetatoxydans Re1]
MGSWVRMKYHGICCWERRAVIVAILEVNKITIKFGGLTAVSNFSLNLKEGEIVGLIGPNGAGKTTAFNAITGIYVPTSGSIMFQGNDITRLLPDKITKLGVARTFQNIRLFENMSVFENVLVGHHLRIKSSFIDATFRTPKYNREEKMMRDQTLELLEKVNLTEYLNEKASSLPYGQQRHLEIARALATRPKLLLLDEPAAGMNPKESEELMEFLKQIRDKFNLTILLIEHHMQVVMGICERILVLDHGITIAEGTPDEVQNNQKVIEAYLGVELDA